MTAARAEDAPVRWGILSTANIARALLQGAREADGVEVVAVGSRDRARGEAFAAEERIGRVHASYEDLLADPDVEAVYNPLPNSLHVPWSLRALEAGKHVLCEKPLTRRAAEAEAAFDAAERAGRLLMEAFMWRYHPQTETLTRLVSDGAVGDLRVVRAAFGFALEPGSANVRWSGELEGGALMDVGCYCVSALRLLAGEPERVSAEIVESGEAGDGVDARVAAVLRFPGDVVGTLDCAFDVPYRAGIEVVGATGTLVSLDPWHGKGPSLSILRPGEDAEQVPVEAANPYRLELEDFSAAIREGREPRLGRADAIAQARTIEALYRAAEDGRAVAV
jgi:predicted dehydrogenase